MPELLSKFQLFMINIHTMSKYNKQRLFEVMGVVDKTFKPRLNEEIETDEFFPITTPVGSEDDRLFVGIVNQGIDSHLEGFTRSKFTIEDGSIGKRRKFNFHQSELPILIRRLEELGTEEALSWKEDIENYDNNINEMIGENESNKNIYKGQYGYYTIDKPIIPDAIEVISQNPEAIKFTDKQSYEELANQQKYFSASHSHCFYSPEEQEQWYKSGNKYSDMDSEQSDILFNTGHELVQVWDNKNNIGYVVPSKRNKEGISEEQEEFVPHGSYTVSNSGGYEVMLNDAGDAARVRDAYGSDNPETSDWLEIVYVSGKPVIDPSGYNIPLSHVMRIR